MNLTIFENKGFKIRCGLVDNEPYFILRVK